MQNAESSQTRGPQGNRGPRGTGGRKGGPNRGQRTSSGRPSGFQPRRDGGKAGARGSGRTGPRDPNAADSNFSGRSRWEENGRKARRDDQGHRRSGRGFEVGKQQNRRFTRENSELGSEERRPFRSEDGSPTDGTERKTRPRLNDGRVRSFGSRPADPGRRSKGLTGPRQRRADVQTGHSGRGNRVGPMARDRRGNRSHPVSNQALEGQGAGSHPSVRDRGTRHRSTHEASVLQSGYDAAPDEPPTPADYDESMLPSAVRAELKGLSKENASVVGAHLLAVGELIDEDPALAYRHAEAARRRAARLPVIREVAAEAAYAAGEYAVALREFRALKRMSGSPDYLAVIADCERALGRPRAALDSLQEADMSTLSASQQIEAVIVEAGARADLGQREEAIRVLEQAIRSGNGPKLAQGRLRYAYAEMLIAANHIASAKEWLAAVANFDPDDQLGALERLAELEEI